MMKKLDLLRVRKVLCEQDASTNSYSKPLDVRFIPIAIIERWRLAGGMDEVGYDNPKV